MTQRTWIFIIHISADPAYLLNLTAALTGRFCQSFRVIVVISPADFEKVDRILHCAAVRTCDGHIEMIPVFIGDIFRLKDHAPGLSVVIIINIEISVRRCRRKIPLMSVACSAQHDADI